MARNLCLNRKMEEAWRYTREADRLSKRYDFKNRSDIYNTYGEIALEAGDYMKAGLYYEQAIREHGFSQAAYVVSATFGDITPLPVIIQRAVIVTSDILFVQPKPVIHRTKCRIIVLYLSQSFCPEQIL